MTHRRGGPAHHAGSVQAIAGRPPCTDAVAQLLPQTSRATDGHVTYFDRRVVCPDSGTSVRRAVQRAGKELDEIYLKCGEARCPHEMVVRVRLRGLQMSDAPHSSLDSIL